ncbi:heat shock factor protein 5 [Cebidichthys violaceus]|uniref:heat shock factor protein 5 n=1 Tax=Cebidichthys violaceus TaxID=271503 RepID=UPI0035CA8969
MDVGDFCLTESINSTNFPAKLWRLVNNPLNKAICWDKDGLVLVIDQTLVEQQVLSPRNSSSASDNADAFKTANFSSFVRNLNLYGFKKSGTYDDVQYRYFYHPNFKRDHPELVASLRRLTVLNKAKIQAGLEVNSRNLRCSGGCDGGDKDGQRVDYSLLSPTHRKWTHPYPPNKAPAVAAHNGTPVPPWFLTRGLGAALSPTVFAADKGIPVTLSQHYAEAASSSNAMLIQQSLMANSNHGNPNFTYNQPGYYMPFYQCYHPNLVASQMAGRGLQKGSYPTHSYYQAGCPVNVLSHVDHNLDSKNTEHQEVKKCDINWDTIYQFAEEVMQTPANSSLFRFVTPVKPGPVSLPLSIKTEPYDNPVSAMKANHWSPRPTVVSVRGSADLLTFKQQEESVISSREHMPEDAIVKVTNDDAKDTEDIDVGVEDTLEDTSTSTGRAPKILLNI